MTEPSHAPDDRTTGDDKEINLFDLLIVLAKQKKLVLGLPLVVAVLAAGISFVLPVSYTATAVIVPPQQSASSSAAMLSQLSGGLAGLASIAGIRTPAELYIGMLRSRTVADNLIQRFDLMRVYETEYPSNARKALETKTAITHVQGGLITIEVDDQDPKRAAAMANAYVDELLKLSQTMAVTEASQRRLFYERQLGQAKDNLARAEEAAKRGIEKGGLAQVEGQGRAIVEATARLRGQITAKEVQIGAMRTFATDRNPDLQLALQELESMKRELARIEGASQAKSGVAPEGSPSGISSVDMLRNVKYFEAIYEFLSKQYELSKIDEARDAPVVQVMDKAIVPDRKSKPKRALIVILSTFGAFLLGILVAFAREVIVRAKADPQQANRLLDLKRYLAWKQE